MPATIPENKRWDETQCAIVCKSSKPAGGCPSGKEWDESSCNCKCSTSMPKDGGCQQPQT